MLSNIWSNQNGGMMPLFAVSLMAAVGLVAMGVSLSYDQRTLNKLQADADAAALAAAVAYTNDTYSSKRTNRLDAAKKVAVNHAAASVWTENNKIDVQAETLGDFGQSARFTVTLSAAPSNQLAKIAGGSANAVRTETAVAEATKALPLCMLSLAPLGTGLDLDGGGTLNAPDCVVWTNSTSVQSMNFSGSGSAIAETFCAAGDAYVGASFSVTPTPSTQCATLPDPLQSWVPPSPEPCSTKGPTRTTSIKGDTASIEPGTYCGGLSVNADYVEMMLGTYFISNGPFRLTGQVEVVGDDVTIILSSPGAQIEARGQAALRITAPTSGPLAGIAIAEDRTTTVDTVSLFNGGSQLDISGVIYLPNQVVRITGNGVMNKVSPYLQMVSRRVELAGTGTLNVTIDDSLSAIDQLVATTSLVRLVK